MQVVLFLWHGVEWGLALFGLLLSVIAGLRLAGGAYMPLVALPPAESEDRERLADDLEFAGGIAWHWIARLLLGLAVVATALVSVTASLLVCVFVALTWPLERAVRALDARDWELRRHRPQP